MNNIYFLMVVTMVTLGCSQSKTTTSNPSPVEEIKERFATPHVFIYKTKADYFVNVPIDLGSDKKSIASYPAPTDLIKGDTFVYPTKLTNGYLLDNRGIGVNVAFLKTTYEEYSKLPEAPSIEVLLSLIRDKDPLVELWDCGIRSLGPSVISELNKLIAEGKLPEQCKRLK